MTPQIALDLSLDTISVLSRTPEGGWWREGTVRLTDADMPERLAALRDVAERRHGSDFVSILVLPDSQLLYTSLERDDRRPDETIRSLLKGRTPYDVADLTWDYVERGDRLQVAVVALDTLMEAESFAAEYGFRPVAVTANPSDPAYPGIPSFGKTGLAGDLLAGATLELNVQDGFRAVPAPPLPEPVVETADEGPTPDAAAEAQAEDEEPAISGGIDHMQSASVDDAAEPEGDHTPTFLHASADQRDPAMAGDATPDLPEPDATPGFVSARASISDTPADPVPSGERLSRVTPRLTATPALGAGRDAPPLPTPADFEVEGTRAARYPIPPSGPSEPPMTAPEARPRFDAPKKGPDAPRSFDAPKKRPVPTIKDGPDRTPPKIPPVAAPGSFAAHLKRRAADPDAVADWEAANARRAAEGDAAATPPAASPEGPKRYDVAPKDAPASLAARIRRRAEEQRAQDAAAAPSEGGSPEPKNEAEALALPGIARAQAAEQRSGARLGLVLTLGLLAILVLIGLGAALLGDEAARAQEEVLAPAGTASLLPVGTPAPAEPEATAALLPPVEEDDRADLGDLLPEPGSVTTGSAGPEGISAPTPIETPVLARSLPEGAQSEDQLQAGILAPDLAQPPSLETAPVAETTPAVFIGIWKADGDFDAPERSTPPATPDAPIVQAALDPSLAGQAAPGLPTVETAPDPLAPRRNPPPVELIGSREAALGLTPATEEWTVLPTGYALLRGRPETLPRPRPGGAAEARLARLAEAAASEAAEPVETEAASEAILPTAADADTPPVDDTADPAVASLAAAALDRLTASDEEAVTLVAATSEGTVAPGGYTVLQGRPATLPSRRPETEAAAPSTETTAADVPAPEVALGDGAPEDLTPTEEGVRAPGGYLLRLGRPETLPAPRPEDAEATEDASVAPSQVEEVLTDETGAAEPAEDPVRVATVDATRDLLAPTEDGVLAPGGYTLRAGQPETMPLPRPGSDDELVETDADDTTALAATEPGTAAPSVEDSVLRRFRPVERPGTVDAEAAARAETLAAEAEAEETALAALRRLQPRQRPDAIAEEAAAAAAAIESARAATEQAAIDAAQQAAAASLAASATASAENTDTGPVSVLALAASDRPRTRPGRVEREAARVVAQRGQVAAAASAATAQPPAAREVDRGSPQIRSAGGNVSAAATERNVLRLNQTNLIGVYGRANARRALVRLSNGRYVKVEVGDRLDRGRVTAIGEDRLQYQRGSRNVVLRLPQG